MNINRQNYESILVDYLDGKLSPEEEAELMLFLLKNPDISEELEGLQEVSVSPNQISFPNKSSLKKQVVFPNGINNEVDYLCIAELEGDISDVDKKRLEKIIEADESVRHIQTVFSSTRLNVPHEIIYPYKSNLKRLQVIPIRRTTYRIAMSVAATVTIMLAVYTAIDFDKSTQMALDSNKPILVTGKVVDTKPNVNIVSKSTLLQTNKTRTKQERSSASKEFNSAISAEKLKNEENISSIPSLPAKIDQIAAITPTKLEIAQSPRNNVPVNTNQYNYQKTGSTKEYTVASIAEIGLKRVANSLGIQYNVQKNDKGKVEKLSIESNLLAFSTTMKKNNE